MIKEAIIPEVNTHFKVRISEIISPSKFWVQKCDQSEELDLLEEGLRWENNLQIVNYVFDVLLTFHFRVFYESDEAIPFEQHHFKPSPGHYIAFYGKEDKTWYRGLIRCYKRPNVLEVSL